MKPSFLLQSGSFYVYTLDHFKIFFASTAIILVQIDNAALVEQLPLEQKRQTSISYLKIHSVDVNLHPKVVRIMFLLG